MKKEQVIKKLDRQFAKKSYTRLTRRKGGFKGISTGFIIDKSSDLILLQESDEFRILGYQIIPISTIKHVRYNKNDQTYERILKKEGLLSELGLKYKIDLLNWKSITKDIKLTGLPIISECEHPDLNYFCVGQLKKVNKKSISIRYFNAQGILDKKNTKHNFADITKLSFDDHYANVFSKYLVENP